MYQDEVLVLLGHNGAGKTTTLNMLTGLTTATQGTAQAHNLRERPIDLFSDYQSIVDLIGLCPQIDVLFE
jgi:ATP-binding cassette subfamily A (ABC1) protein 3